MDKKMKVVLAILAVVIIAAVGAYYFISTMDVTLEGSGAQVTLPNTYKLDDKGLASNGSIKMTFVGVLGDTKLTTDFLNAVKANGNASGYKNFTENTINGFKVYEFSANPKELKTVKSNSVSSGSSVEWMEYPPTPLVDSSGANINCDHYREVTYVSPNNSSVNQLLIYSDNPNADLYTPEINKIVESIHTKSQ